MPLDFTQALDKKPEEIERPPLMPIGTYRWQIEKHPEIDNTKDPYQIVNFQLKCMGAEDDVDPDALREFGSLANIRQRHSFLFNTQEEADFKRAEWNLKTFLTEHVKCWQNGASLKEALAASVGGQFLGQIKWKADKQNTDLFHANIAKTAPVD